ncbi:RIBOSOMAL PROTEIN S15P/S13E, partial [Salix viminalis]
ANPRNGNDKEALGFAASSRGGESHTHTGSGFITVTMGRMHSHGKGISASALPYKRTPPSWLKISAQDVSFKNPVLPFSLFSY